MRNEYPLPENVEPSKENPFLLFKKQDIEKMKSFDKDKEYKILLDYIAKIVFNDPSLILNPMTPATDIEKKHYTSGFRLMGFESKLYAIAIYWAITKDKRLIIEAQKAIEEITNLSKWSDDIRDNMDFQNTSPETGAIMRGMAVILDVMKEELDKDLLKRARRHLGSVSQRLSELIHDKYGIFFHKNDDWTIDIGSALGMAAMCLYKQDERAIDWLQNAHNMVFDYLESMPEDGSHVLGVIRWEYVLLCGALYVQSLYNFSCIDYRKNSFFDRSKYFAIECATPNGRNVVIMDEGVPLYISRQLAGTTSKILSCWFDDPYIAWGIDASKYICENYNPLEILYLGYCKNILPPDEKFKSKIFKNSGYGILRSGYGKNDCLVSFKSSVYDYRFQHFNQNAIEVFVEDFNVILDSGTSWMHHLNYSNRYRDTSAHSSILVDGKGQKTHTKNTGGNIVKFETNENFDYICGDASRAYSKVDKFLRHILFIKPDILIIYDYIELESIGTVEWLWHGCGEFFINPLKDIPNFTIKAEKNITGFIVEPENWSYKIQTGFQTDNWFHGHEITHPVLNIKKAYSKIHKSFLVVNLKGEEMPGICNKDNKELIINKGILSYKIKWDKKQLFYYMS